MSEIPPQPSPKKEIIAPRQESADEEVADDPPGVERNYGEARLWLIARDPRCLFAYWEFRTEEHPAAIGKDGSTRFSLRIFSESGEAESSVEIEPGRGNAFIPARSSDSGYFAELGFFAGGIWCFLARSGITHTPPALPGAGMPAIFATIPAQLNLSKMRDIVAGSALFGESPAATVARIQTAARHHGEWTPEQERLLAEILGARDTTTAASAANPLTLTQAMRQKLAATAEAAAPGVPIAAQEIEFAPTTPGASWPSSR